MSFQKIFPSIQKYSLLIAQLLLLFSFISIPLIVHGDVQALEHCHLRAHLSGDEMAVLSASPKLFGTPGYDAGTALYLVPNIFINPGDAALFCLYTLIKYFANLVFFILGALATLFIAYAAFLFITSSQNPSRRNAARSFLLYAIIGLIIAALAKAIPFIVRGIIGFS